MRLLIRLCPSEDGTFKATKWDGKLQEYVEISPQQAVLELASENSKVEVAVNDPLHASSHYESDHSPMRRI